MYLLQYKLHKYIMKLINIYKENRICNNVIRAPGLGYTKHQIKLKAQISTKRGFV